MFDELARKWSAVDSFLLDRCFQPISDRVRDTTGRSNFWIANWAVRLLFAIIAGSVMYGVGEVYANHQTLPLLASIVCIAIISRPDKLFKLSTYLEEHAEAMAEEIDLLRVVNPYRGILAASRFAGVMYSLLTWSLIGYALVGIREALWLGIAVQLIMATNTVVAYFLSCTPKPRKPHFSTKRALA